MAREVYISEFDIERIGPPRTPDDRPRRDQWDTDGYAWAYAEWQKARGEERGYRIPEGMQPSSVKLKGAPETFPVFCAGRLCTGVSQSFRDVIERFEPGLHQFIPFELLDQDNVPVTEPYYFMNVMTCLDALLVEHSAVRWFSSGDNPPNIDIVDDKRLAMSRPKIAGKHIWRSPISPHYFFSKALYPALVDAGFEELLYSAMEYAELDIAWDRSENRGPVDRWVAEFQARNTKTQG